MSDSKLKTSDKEQPYENNYSPDNKKGIAVQMIALNSCIIVLEYDFHECFVSTINYGRINFCWPVHHFIGEVQLENAWDVKLLSKF